MSKKKAVLAVSCVAIAIAMLGLAAVVYAKYTSLVENTSSISVAKWAFTEDNQSDSVDCDFTETYDSDTLVDDRIAPGTSGVCQISISNKNTEVGVHYTVKLSSTNTPTHMKLYKDANHNTEITDGIIAEDDMIAKQNDTVPIYVYWYWPYEDEGGTEAYDAIDTTDGINASAMSIKLDITGTQINPGS